jgi:uncharacterized membrane protein YhaH (DUF805 family)
MSHLLAASSSAGIGGGIAIGVVYLALVVLWIAGLWKTLEKAGHPGWWAIIPILNLYGIIKTAGREGWWIILYLIPCVNIVVAVIVSLDVAKSFGKSTGFGIGLWILPFIFFLMLGFGDAVYQGPAAAPGSAPGAAPAT